MKSCRHAFIFSYLKDQHQLTTTGISVIAPGRILKILQKLESNNLTVEDVETLCADMMLNCMIFAFFYFNLMSHFESPCIDYVGEGSPVSDNVVRVCQRLVVDKRALS